MPSDLTADDPDLLITNRRGEELPFSRGIMATSLLATGLPTEKAYRLASAVQKELHADRRTHHDADELVSITSELLRGLPGGDDVVDRWLAWREARRSGRPIVVVLTGAPGVGKSTLATRLAVRLEITRMVTSDAIREVLRTVVPPTVLAELHSSTFELIDPDRTDAFTGFDRQCTAVGNAMCAVAGRLCTENRSMIAEGVHLPPGMITDALVDHPSRPVVVERLVTATTVAHRSNLYQRREREPLRGGDRHVDGFDRIELIKRHLAQQATARGVDMIDIADSNAMTQELVGEIVGRLRAVAA